LIYLFEKFGKKLQWRLLEKLNCHNLRYVQDRIVIFGSRMWFSGSA